MAYVDAEARQDLLDSVADAIEALGAALAALGEAYEQLDESSADTLEEELFKPVQAAYGRARSTHAEFAARHGLPGREFAAHAGGHPSQGVKGFIDAAVEDVRQADTALSALQDSMLPVEVGDPEVRAGIAEVRSIVGDVPQRSRRFVSRFGR